MDPTGQWNFACSCLGTYLRFVFAIVVLVPVLYLLCWVTRKKKNGKDKQG